jgi:DNA (cytosine-5)-methyltransferase 1
MNSIDKTRQDNGYACSHECQVVVLGNMDNTIDHTFESANRVYDKNNLCPTIPTCAGGGIQPKVIEETKCVGGLSTNKWGGQYHQQDRVYKGDIALAHPANIPEGSYKYIVAMRGKNPEKPNDRTPGIHTEQRLEMNKDGLVNTLTTVQKDNLVMEKEKINKVGQISNEGNQCGTVVSSEGLFPTLTAGTHGYANFHVCNTYRIRKLTPCECWRLMGYTDTDFDKAAAVNSNTQLYKEAGNAIVKQVLMAIFSQMNIKGVKPWNGMTSEEKYNLIQKSTAGKKSKK